MTQEARRRKQDATHALRYTYNMERRTDLNHAPVWLWRLVASGPLLVVGIGLAAAVWLGTRPVATGAPVSSRELGAWTFGPGATGDVTDERLALRTSAPNHAAYAASALNLSDGVFEIRAALADGPEDAGYGLIVRHAGPSDFIALLIGPDGYLAIGQMSGGAWRWRVPWQQWPHIKRGEAENLLRAHCRAERCRFYINDEFAFELDGVPDQGQTGAVVWNPAQGQNVGAAFRAWRVWK